MQLGDLAKCTQADFTKQGSDGWISFPQSFHFKMFQATIKYHYVISFPVRPTRLRKCPPITSKGLAAGSPQYWQLRKEHKCYAQNFFFCKTQQDINSKHNMSTDPLLICNCMELTHLYPKTWSIENALKLGWSHFPACQGLSLSYMPVVPDSRIKLPFLEKYS